MQKSKCGIALRIPCRTCASTFCIPHSSFCIDCAPPRPKLPSAPHNRPLTTEDRVTGVNDGQAALERGRAVMLVTPPAVEQAGAVWELVASETPGRGPVSPPGPATVIVCSDTATAEEWADAAPQDLRVHPVTALGRTTRLLAAGAVDVLAGTPEDLQALARASALKLETVTTAVLAW